MDYNLVGKVGKKYYCEKCDYFARDKSNFNKHLLTHKHNRITNGVTMDYNNDLLCFECICGNKYKHRQGLYKHKKNCKSSKNSNFNENNNNEDDNTCNEITELVELVKTLLVQQTNQAEQQQKMLTEIIPKIGNTTNNNNNQFNINMFLNEKCKDAINIKEFIDMIVFNKDTMDDSKNLGIEKTMTNLIIDKLNSLDIHKRPIHCSDIRRETIYVKDNGEWTKTNTKTILKKMIRSIQDKGCTTLSEWRKQNPDDPKGNPDLLDPNALYYHKVIKQVCLETEKRLYQEIITVL